MDLLAKGWECPKCGAVMSPTTSCCVNCRGQAEYTINTGDLPIVDWCKELEKYKASRTKESEQK